MNRVNIIGRICTDLELQTLGANGTKVLKIVIALNGMKKNDETYETHFVDCVAFQKVAELLADNFKKGELIAIEGSLRTNIFQKSNGTKIKQTSVLVEKITFIKTKGTIKETTATQAQKQESNDFTNNADNFMFGVEDLPF